MDPYSQPLFIEYWFTEQEYAEKERPYTKWSESGKKKFEEKFEKYLTQGRGYPGMLFYLHGLQEES